MSAGDLINAGAAVLAGLVALIAPRRVIAWKARSFARRRVGRWLRGRDAYFEEARTLDAYPPPTHPGRVRLAGGAILTLGIILAVSTIHH